MSSNCFKRSCFNVAGTKKKSQNVLICDSCDHKLGPLNEFVIYTIKCNELNLAAAAMLTASKPMRAGEL